MIRLPTLDDQEAFMRMGRSFYEASPYSKFTLSEQKLLDLFTNSVYNKDSYLLLMLVDKENRPKGMILCAISSSFFSEDKVATELAWWVDPDYRGRDALDLVSAYEYWAKEVHKCKAASLALLDHTSNPKIQKYYERLGFHKVEEAYLKEF